MKQNLTDPLRLIFSIENFYKNSKLAVVTNAAHGWYYVAGSERKFVENIPVRSDKKYYSSDIKNAGNGLTNTDESKRDPAAILASLNENEPLEKKFKKLKALINNRDPNLIIDSFGPNIDIQTAQKKTFNRNQLNIVIVGAGVTGLYLACLTKYALGDGVYILVLDNRSEQQGRREVFNREWLTHIPFEIFRNFTPANIRGLIGCFGLHGSIGLHINLLEALLMLSCKEQGVKFYFSPNIDTEKLNHPLTSFMFDATGGRLSEYDYSTIVPALGDQNLENLIQNYQYIGPIAPDTNLNNINIKLKAFGQVHFPYMGNIRIQTHMFKITGIPGRLLNAVQSLIDPLNNDNAFYLWEGALKDEFNEGLVFVNITYEEYEHLISNLSGTMDLNLFIAEENNVYSSLGTEIRTFLEQLSDLNSTNTIKVNRPFTYSPHINLNAGFECIADKRIFPIGDSYFCGHPKVGNGLWTHLGFINELVVRMVTAYKGSVS